MELISKNEMVKWRGYWKLSAERAIRELIETLMRSPPKTRADVNQEKMHVAAKFELDMIPSNSEIISALTKSENEKLLPLLTRKIIRTASGVTVVAAMTKPYPCPQTEPCAYCPGGPKLGVPQSYTGHEPATMRGIQNQYNPYKQVKNRINQLQAIGHKVDKIELIIMGGTFPATPIQYQTMFVKRCLDAITQKKSQNLEKAKKNAEKSKIRNVGITVETRPDWAKESQVDNMLNMGVTRVELGVQNPDDAIYRKVGRMHTVKDVIEATRIVKDAGLKLVYHLMPGMPGSNPVKDLRAFKKVFSSQDFKPDMIKIYPCLVTENTKVFNWYQKGNYRPYSTEQAVEVVAEIKRMTPPWVRIMRIQRDIPSPLIVSGVKKGNLRELAQAKLTMQGVSCKCIRCREVGHRVKSTRARSTGVKPSISVANLVTMKYNASEGEEIFVSAENTNDDTLFGYIRLRIPSTKAHRTEIKTKPCSIVRELHVYGPLVPVNQHIREAWQHKGLGKTLLSEAERMTKEDYGLRRILVISALGTKQYYANLGYHLDGVYMSKELR